MSFGRSDSKDQRRVPPEKKQGHSAAKGGLPRARVAAYKVCWPPIDGGECFDADILAAFDMVIHDGVDVLFVSLSGQASALFNDSVAIGSFHAAKRGIVVVCSAGNSGLVNATTENLAPWYITVGASTMDREFPSYVVLGNQKSLKVCLLPYATDLCAMPRYITQTFDENQI